MTLSCHTRGPQHLVFITFTTLTKGVPAHPRTAINLSLAYLGALYPTFSTPNRGAQALEPLKPLNPTPYIQYSQQGSSSS